MNGTTDQTVFQVEPFQMSLSTVKLESQQTDRYEPITISEYPDISHIKISDLPHRSMTSEGKTGSFHAPPQVFKRAQPTYKLYQNPTKNVI